MQYRSGSVDSLANNIAAAWESPFDYAAISAQSLPRFSAERYLDRVLEIYQG